MTKESHPSKYLSFLLRMWQENPLVGWRASLENPQTGERRVFASLDALFEYIKEHIQAKDFEE